MLTAYMPKNKSRPDASDAPQHSPAPPNAFLLAMEFRAFWEFGSVLPSWPVLRKAPRGDGHSVIVFPGLSAGDGSTFPLRRYLDSLNYQTSGWNQGFNFGARAGVLESAKRQVHETAQRSGEPVSLIGWSLGGVYARELAKMMPDEVRGVITLGTPFSGSPKSTNAWRIYELTSGRNIDQDSTKFDLKAAPPVPTTSLFSRSDGIVAWQASIQAPCRINRHTENVEVVASHVGMGVNPAVWWVIADRLAHPVGAWKPFERKAGRLNGLIFPDPAR